MNGVVPTRQQTNLISITRHQFTILRSHRCREPGGTINLWNEPRINVIYMLMVLTANRPCTCSYD